MKRFPHNRWHAGRTRRIWLIGASSGIGAELARALLAEGHEVALSSRSIAALRAITEPFGARARVLPCDVTSAESLRIAAHALQQQWGGIDTLIYNAGICEYIDDGRIDTDTVARVMDTNMLGLCRALEIALPLMSAGAQVAAVSSSAAFVPLPRAEAYGASKAAMNYLLEALRLPLRERGISVNVICPGFVKTPLTDRNDFPMPCLVTAEDAAQAIIDGLRRDRALIHFPKRFTQFLRLIGVLPGALQRWFTGSLVRT